MANGKQLKLAYENSECSQGSGPVQAADQKLVLAGNIKKLNDKMQTTKFPIGNNFATVLLLMILWEKLP